MTVYKCKLVKKNKYIGPIRRQRQFVDIEEKKNYRKTCGLNPINGAHWRGSSHNKWIWQNEMRRKKKNYRAKEYVRRLSEKNHPVEKRYRVHCVDGESN